VTDYTYTVEDMSRALMMTPHDIRRCLRRIKEPKSPRGAYQWNTSNFSAACRRARAAAMPYEVGLRPQDERRDQWKR
jgi:hypothetical protein